MTEKTLRLTRAALIAALYVILTFISQIFGLASGVIQFRLSEALTCMPLFYREAIPGLWIGCVLANLLTGSFIVERLFAIPGLGKYFVDSITARDYNIIMGVTIFLGVFVVACNLLVDVVYGVIDPRVKLDE